MMNEQWGQKGYPVFNNLPSSAEYPMPKQYNDLKKRTNKNKTNSLL